MAHRSEMLTINGVSTHVIRGGRGAPLLVLPPEFAPGRWFPYHDQLASRFLVVAPDHPGFGQSERPDWLEGIDDVVLHYLDLLDHLGVERASLIGTSLGGWIAAELAVIQPQRVEKLVLVGAAGLKVEGVERYDVFLNPLERTLEKLFFDKSRTAQLLSTEIGPETIVRAYRDSASLARFTWNPYFYNPKLERRLRRIRCPTLIVWGREDEFLPLAHGLAFEREIRGSSLRVIERCGHFVPFEQTQAFIDVAMAFLDREG